MTALYLDVTHTLVTGMATGIQRVVRKVTAELLRQSPPGIDVVRPVVAVDRTFLLLDAGGIDRLLYPSVATSHALAPGAAARLVAHAVARLPAVTGYLQHRRFTRRAEEAIGVSLAPAEIGSDDILLLLDAFWGGSASLNAARTVRDRGTSVTAVVHDLIPVTHPNYMTPVARRLFAHRLRQAINLCDGFAVVSRSTAEALATFAYPQSVRMEIAYNGSDIAAVPEDVRRTSSQGTFICVGTLEPRKGHAVVLDAFERLWAAGSTSRLIFVGRRGWSDELVWRRCQALLAHGAPFELINDADDNALTHLLVRSSAAIVASEVEGFGLPVVEALNRNLPVIASDIPVFREIASGAVRFFPVGDAAALADAVTAFERDPAPLREAARLFVWPTWRESAAGYAAAALRIRERTRAEQLGGRISR